MWWLGAQTLFIVSVACWMFCGKYSKQQAPNALRCCQICAILLGALALVIAFQDGVQAARGLPIPQRELQLNAVYELVSPSEVDGKCLAFLGKPGETKKLYELDTPAPKTTSVVAVLGEGDKIHLKPFQYPSSQPAESPKQD